MQVYSLEYFIKSPEHEMSLGKQKKTHDIRVHAYGIQYLFRQQA